MALDFPPTGLLPEPHNHTLPALEWDLLLYGFVPVTWEKVQHQHLQTLDPDSTTSGRSWTTCLISTIWHQLQLRWFARNQDTYSSDDNPQTQHLQSQIHTLFAQKSAIPVEFHRPFVKDITEILGYSSRQQEAWINNASPVVKQGLRVAQEQQRLHQPPISKYFTPLRHSDSSDPMRLDNRPLAPD